jgi:predicted kinase
MSSVKIGSPEEESLEGDILTEVDFILVTDEYWRSLDIPVEQPKKKLILCPIGLVGSGKSTVIKPLSIQLHLVRVSGDEVRKLLKERGFNWTRTIEIVFSIIERLLERGYSVAIDSDCAGKNVTSTLEDEAGKYGYKVLYIHINPPEAFIINKLKNFKHSWLFKDSDDALRSYVRRKPLHDNLQLPYVYTFDPSRSDIGEQITAAVKSITPFVV